MWVQRLFKFVETLEKQTKNEKVADNLGNGSSENRADNIEEADEEVITLQSLIETLRLFCRSTPETADTSIYHIFNISNSRSKVTGDPKSTETICWKDIQMMLLNLPILGFTMS